MTSYKSKSGKETGVEAFETGADFIRVKFKHAGQPYTYSWQSAGKTAVEKMKMLARAQKGLSTYISQHKPPYE